VPSQVFSALSVSRRPAPVDSHRGKSERASAARPRNLAERAAPTRVNLNLSLAEASDGGGFGIVYVENRKQLGYLKHFLEF
jgi:hypothetical protein